MSAWRREGCHITASPDLNPLFPAGPNLFVTLGSISLTRMRVLGVGRRTAVLVLEKILMSWRVRHCVECPRCLTRYLIGFSPYGNESYLVPNVGGSSEEYTLYCSCKGRSVASRWRWGDVKTCAVSRVAYRRGYGTPEEVLTMRPSAA